ncbi:hypothetical protein K2173_001277 [Erythroxylum novogranatense]|uniref:non-specific serine/threonine protein kinase n=1 Tax=Erythroxylum novogranatense TaxID=1862640 RepID=A0AAV8T4B5_9ROSI|nr:hypothetical protein K2173_001277 [Erythroxylum novogranatense]
MNRSSSFAFSPVLLHLLIILFFLVVDIPSCFCDSYSDCSTRYVCGNLNVTYPFWGNQRPEGCGLPEFELRCRNDNTTIELNNVTYQVLKITADTQIFRIARQDFADGFCPPEFVNTTLDPQFFEVANGYTNLTFVYGCLSIMQSPLTFNCNVNGATYQSSYVQPGAVGPGSCYKSVYVPVSDGVALAGLIDKAGLENDLAHGFEVRWTTDYDSDCNDCVDNVGACGYNLNSTQFSCYCPTGSTTCSSSSDSGSNSSKKSVGVGVGVAAVALVGISLGGWFLIAKRRKKKAVVEDIPKPLPPSKGPSTDGFPTSSTYFSRTTPSYTTSTSDLEKGSTYFGVQVFSYKELEQATDNFDPAKQLGDGGFGTVFYGVLNDGRVVAVKRLFENNMKRAEQFMNEIEILARLRHKNLVTLYGCSSRRSQDLLLVYEYIPNGTVADHLHGRRTDSRLLTWPVRLSIAIETAGALAYLHASDVIHRDVKTNNILLDNQFCVKVADFGLSRLLPTDVTHVSTAPQGTPGYVDPEYYQCFQLTEKSDVYSFGVVLIELVSSLEPVDTSRDRQEINLASMAINKIQNHAVNELVDPCLGFDRDYSVQKMVTAVAALAFRCLQQDKDMRPTMQEVLQALKQIESEYRGSKKTEVKEIGDEDVGLLKHAPASYSPDSVVQDKWVSSSSISNSL